MFLLNGSGLLVQVEEATPTTAAGPWGNAFFPRGSLKDPDITPKLSNSVETSSGLGSFFLDGLVYGDKGSVLLSLVTGAQGHDRTIGYLTDDPSSPTNRIEFGIGPFNRPYVVLYDATGVLQGRVIPTFGTFVQGAQVLVLISWDSSQVIDGARFALLQVNRNLISNESWETSPESAWTSFRPTHLVLGKGVGASLDFNGRVAFIQISNEVTPGSASVGQLPDTRVFDRVFTEDSVVTETLLSEWSTHFYRLELGDTAVVSDALTPDIDYVRAASDTVSVSDQAICGEG